MMDGILQEIPNTICYLDDILVTGQNDEEHLNNLEKVLAIVTTHYPVSTHPPPGILHTRGIMNGH